MVAAAAQAHRVFLQDPPARGGFPGVHQGGGGAGDLGHHGAGEGGDAREALEKIEGHPLAGEDRGHGAGEAGQDRAFRHLLAVVHCRRKNYFRIQLTKNPGRHGQARHHQGGLGPDMGFPLQLRGDQGLGGDIPRADILFQGQVDEAVKVGGIEQVIH